MNWTLEYEESDNFVRVVCEGEFTPEDCMKMKIDIISSDFWRPGMNILLDYRHTKFQNLRLDELREVGEFHIFKSREIGGGKMAFLMKSPRDYGLARQYELLTEEKVLSKMMAFSDENEALEWIGS